jgi:hypothetical protein
MLFYFEKVLAGGGQLLLKHLEQMLASLAQFHCCHHCLILQFMGEVELIWVCFLSFGFQIS